MSKSVDAKVRGFCYFCTSSSSVNVTLDKNIYSPGETVKVTVECDNTHCKHEVSNFIVALKRKVWIQTEDGEETNRNKVLTSERFEGSPSGTKQTRECSITIPETEEEPKFLIWAPLRPMLRSLSGTYDKGKLITIEYKIKLYVRYGNLWRTVASTSHPIKIVAKPIVIPDGRYVEAPINWNPIVYEESVHALPIQPPNSDKPVVQTARSYLEAQSIS